MLKNNYDLVKESLLHACDLAGRAPGSVKLLAVTKNVSPQDILSVYALGQRAFGENRVQELCEKQPELPKDIEWHFIGRLQRNKVKYIIDKVAMIHSVDSLGLAKEISRQAQLKGLQDDMPVLIQLNLGGEQTKGGFDRDTLRRGVEEIATLPGLSIQGLMTIGPYFEDPEGTRPLFHTMRALMDEVDSWSVPGVRLRYLSMGMSHDFHIAIEEGADIVRVGSAIFGAR